MRISELAVDAVFTPSWLAHAIVRLTRRVDARTSSPRSPI